MNFLLNLSSKLVFMKTFITSIFFLLSSLLSFGQNQPPKMIVILPFTTYSYYEDINCVSLPVYCPRQFNDVGLQAIFTTYSIDVPEVGYYDCSTQNQNYSAVELYGISSSTYPAFTQDLENYNQGVIAVDYLPGVPNQVYYTLLDNSVGSFQNITNGIVTTNNAALNQIFIDYNVFDITEFNQQKLISCNCNGVQLANTLNNLTNVTQSSFNSCGIAYLLNDESFSKSKTLIYPNPFSTILNIETSENINVYNVYDILGKKIIETSFNDDLKIKLSQVNSGIYFLNLLFDDGKIENIKIIKN
jgi:hypothetical protein